MYLIHINLLIMLFKRQFKCLKSAKLTCASSLPVAIYVIHSKFSALSHVFISYVHSDMASKLPKGEVSFISNFSIKFN